MMDYFVNCTGIDSFPPDHFGLGLGRTGIECVPPDYFGLGLGCTDIDSVLSQPHTHYVQLGLGFGSRVRARSVVDHVRIMALELRRHIVCLSYAFHMPMEKSFA